jgi:Tol biopolymer transport system component
MQHRVKFLTLVFAALVCGQSWARAQGPWRISVSSQGTQGAGVSDRPIVCGDGRLAVFTSLAEDLVPGDGNGFADVFLHDLAARTTELVSISLSGVAGNGSCLWPVISQDGSTVSFSSLASDLVPGDTNSVGDIFVRDLASGVTSRVSLSSAGAQADSGGRGSALSADGRFVAFMSAAGNLVPGDTNALQDIFVRDRARETTERVSVSSTGVQADGHSGGPWISADGRFVTFGSEASNLVEGDANQQRDVFVHDRLTHRTTRASLSSSGVEGNSFSGFNHLTGYFTTFISPDARWVVFHSYATNLVAGDTNDSPDIFVHDRRTRTTVRASVASDGTESDGFSYFPVMFGDGRYVSFFSKGTTLVPGDTNLVGDVFVRDLWAGVTERISLNAKGEEGDLASDYPSAALDGSLIVIESEATNFVRGDSNDAKDLFALRREPAGELAVSSCGSAPDAGASALSIGWSGSPRLGSSEPFVLHLDGLEPGTTGILVYSSSASLPVSAAGLPCIVPPWRWLAAQPGQGSLCVDLGAHFLRDPALAPGTFVRAQFRTRDVELASERSSPVVTFALRP